MERLPVSSRKQGNEGQRSKTETMPKASTSGTLSAS